MSVAGEEAGKEKEKQRKLEEYVNRYRTMMHPHDVIEAYCRRCADVLAWYSEQIEITARRNIEPDSSEQIAMFESWQKQELWESIVADVLEAERLVLQLAPDGDAASRLTSTTDIQGKIRLIDSFVDSLVIDSFLGSLEDGMVDKATATDTLEDRMVDKSTATDTGTDMDEGAVNGADGPKTDYPNSKNFIVFNKPG